MISSNSATEMPCRHRNVQVKIIATPGFWRLNMRKSPFVYSKIIFLMGITAGFWSLRYTIQWWTEGAIWSYGYSYSLLNGELRSYQEFPNHILHIYIYILDMVSLVGRNELLLYDPQESSVALEHLYLQVSDLQENGGNTMRTKGRCHEVFSFH